MTSRGTRYWSSASIPLIAPELLGDIISAASDIAIVVTREGQVLSVLVSTIHKSFGPLDHWETYDLREFLTTESSAKLDAQLLAISEGSHRLRPVELNHMESARWEFPVRYTFHPISPDGTVLMLGRDLRPMAEIQQQLVQAQLALERDYETQREYDTRYRVLMETTQEPMVFIAMASGRITDINNAAALLLGGTREELTGAAFAQEFEGRKRNEMIEMLVAAAQNETGEPVAVQARRSRRRLLVMPTFFRASGERVLLCRFEYSEAGGGQTDDLARNLAGMFKGGVEGIVFTDAEGTIRAANESFLNLADAANAATVKGRSLGDFLVRGSIDLKVMLENATRVGHLKLYTAKLASDFGTQVPVEITVTYLADRAYPSLVFMFRDASHAETSRPQAVPQLAGETARSVMDLVGSATLKDIVAETTDVVEKMCIETAVELTRNNRVAAAEMLGLSRQSLYVKLRKYGLLARGEEA